MTCLRQDSLPPHWISKSKSMCSDVTQERWKTFFFEEIKRKEEINELETSNEIEVEIEEFLCVYGLSFKTPRPIHPFHSPRYPCCWAAHRHTGESESKKKQHKKEKLKLDDVVRISESRLWMEFIIIWKHFSRVLCKSWWINQMENKRRRRWRVQSSIWNCFDIIEWIHSLQLLHCASIALHCILAAIILCWVGWSSRCFYCEIERDR